MDIGKCSSLNAALLHKRNAKHADSRHVGCLLFAKFSGKPGWKVNGTRLFGSFLREISGSNETSQKVVLFFPDGTFQKEIRVQFLQIKPSLIPVSGLRVR